MKAIGIKIVELQPMRASMALQTGYKIGKSHPDDMACQLTSMRNYSDTLLSRLTRAGVDFKELI